jgi:hypothetical protein
MKRNILLALTLPLFAACAQSQQTGPVTADSCQQWQAHRAGLFSSPSRHPRVESEGALFVATSHDPSPSGRRAMERLVRNWCPGRLVVRPYGVEIGPQEPGRPRSVSFVVGSSVWDTVPDSDR